LPPKQSRSATPSPGKRSALEAKLDESFFRVRAERVTELELQYLRAMAELGPGEQSAGDVAAVLGRTSDQPGPTRARLIDKGLIYTTSHGHGNFTAPNSTATCAATTNSRRRYHDGKPVASPKRASAASMN
jgi:hypothetical protein